MDSCQKSADRSLRPPEKNKKKKFIALKELLLRITIPLLSSKNELQVKRKIVHAL